MHAVLKQFKEQKNAQIEYLGHAHGMDGWLIKGKSDGGDEVVQYAYTTPEGGLVMGFLFGPDGDVTTARQLEAYRDRIKSGGQAAAPIVEDKKTADGKTEESKAPKAERFYALTEQASWIKIGKDDAPYMYVFINPTCDHCVDYWNALKRSVDDGTLQVRFVPFGVVEENRITSSALLAAKDPDEAWRGYVGGNKMALSRDMVTDDTLKMVDKNTALFGQFGVKSGPPFTIYRSPADGKIKAMAGKPQNIMMLLSDFMK